MFCLCFFLLFFLLQLMKSEFEVFGKEKSNEIMLCVIHFLSQATILLTKFQKGEDKGTTQRVKGKKYILTFSLGMVTWIMSPWMSLPKILLMLQFLWFSLFCIKWGFEKTSKRKSHWFHFPSFHFPFKKILLKLKFFFKMLTKLSFSNEMKPKKKNIYGIFNKHLRGTMDWIQDSNASCTPSHQHTYREWKSKKRHISQIWCLLLLVLFLAVYQLSSSNFMPVNNKEKNTNQCQTLFRRG